VSATEKMQKMQKNARHSEKNARHEWHSVKAVARWFSRCAKVAA
jgi:hypothetical protein